jgi:hypothetical protein
MSNAATKLAQALGDHFTLWKVGPGGVCLHIDTSDPDTPAMVYSSMRKRASATFECAVNAGELTGHGNGEDDSTYLSPGQQQWLEQFRPKVDEAFEVARRGMKEYA